MKNTKGTRGPVTGALLAGLANVKLLPSRDKATGGSSKKAGTVSPAFGKSQAKQPDLYQDAGGGYNSDFTAIQK